MDLVQKAIKYIPCPRCGAMPSYPCVTKTGFTYLGSWYVHESRREPFVEEYRRGYWLGARMERRIAERARTPIPVGASDATSNSRAEGRGQ